ncbi:MAG: tetratricopeptide repeat protein, partial [Cytophagales bacterium]
MFLIRFFTAFFAFSCLYVEAQLNLKGLDKLTDKTNNLLNNDIIYDGISSLNKKLAESRREFEEKTFNYAISLSDNAGLFENEERFSKNKNLFLSSLATYANDASPADLASSRNNIGEMLYASNKYVMAEQAFNKAIEICEVHGLTNQAIYALAVSNKGLLLHTMGRYAQSEIFTQKGLELRKNLMGENSPVYAASVNNFAVLNKDMGDYQEALELIDKSIAINSTSLGKQSMAYAINLNNKAIMSQAIGHYDESVKLMNEALTIAEKELGEKSNNFLRMKTNLALIFKDMGRFSDAEEVLKDCIRRKEKKLGSNHPDYAHMITNLAMLYQLMGKNKEVEDLLKKAQNIYKKKFGENHPAYATASANLGNYYRNQSKTELALPLLQKALEVRKTMLGENHPDYVNSLEDMAIVNWVLNDFAEASKFYALSIDKTLDFINTFFPSMSESEKNKLWSRFFPRINRYYSFAVKTNQSQEIGKMYDLHISTKGILLSTSSKVKEKIMNSGDKELIKLFKQWVDQKEELVRLYAYSKNELIEQRINLDSLEKAANTSEKNLSQKSDLFTQGLKKSAYSWKDICNVLSETESCVEVINFKKYDGVKIDSSQYVALVLRKGSIAPLIKKLKFGAQLDKRYYNYYTNSIKTKSEDKLSYKVFWKEIDSLTANSKTVFVSLDGIFNQVNLNSLKNTETGKFVIETQQLILLGNTREV